MTVSSLKLVLVCLGILTKSLDLVHRISKACPKLFTGFDFLLPVPQYGGWDFFRILTDFLLHSVLFFSFIFLLTRAGTCDLRGNQGP